MIGHFRAFAAATGDTFWSTTAIDKSYALIDRMQTVYSPGVGLMPDFIINCDTNPIPSPGGYGDFTDTEGWLYANAIRNPWRWGTDYVFSGDWRWKSVLQKTMNFLVADTGNDPAKMATGYRLDGSLNDPTGQNRLFRPYLSYWGPYASIAPAMLGGMVDASYEGWVNASWDWTDGNRKTSYTTRRSRSCASWLRRATGGSRRLELQAHSRATATGFAGPLVAPEGEAAAGRFGGPFRRR